MKKMIILMAIVVLAVMALLGAAKVKEAKKFSNLSAEDRAVIEMLNSDDTLIYEKDGTKIHLFTY